MDERHLISWAPWRPGDLAHLIPIIAAGVAAWAVAWLAASGEAHFGDQIGWVSVSVIGLGLTFAAEAAWLLRGRQAVSRHRRELAGRISVAPSPTRPATSYPGQPSAQLVAGDGLVRFHRADCPIAAGQGWALASRESHRRAGRKPCGVCRP